MDPFVAVLSGVLLLTIAIVCIIWYLRSNVFGREGRGARRKTKGILRRYAVLRRFRVLSALPVTGKDGTTHLIECMLIGHFGVLLVTTLGARGEYYGTLDGESWTRVLDDRRHELPNPVREQVAQEAALRQIFAANKIYSVPVHRVVYITDRSQKTGIYVTHGGEILPPSKLGAYLERTLFDKDNGVDVERLAALLEAGAGRSS